MFTSLTLFHNIIVILICLCEKSSSRSSRCALGAPVPRTALSGRALSGASASKRTTFTSKRATTTPRPAIALKVLFLYECTSSVFEKILCIVQR